MMDLNTIKANPMQHFATQQTLSVPVETGNMWGYGSVSGDNLFLQPVQQQDYQAEVALDLLPRRAFEQAGIGIYWDDDNYIKVSKEMFNGRLSLVFVTERAGQPRINHILDYPDAHVRFKLEKSEGVVNASFQSGAESDWQALGSTSLLPGTEQGVMLYTFSGSALDPSYVTFANFMLK